MRFEPGLRALSRLALGLMLALMVMAVPSQAQAPPPAAPPPMPSQIDEHGVDLTSGKLVMGNADVSIGPSDHRGLRFSRQWTNTAWRIAELPTISGSTTYPVVSFGGRSVPFETVSGIYKAVFQDGSTLSADRTTFTASDGTQVIFAAGSYRDYANDSTLGLGSQVIFPDGARWTYYYETGSASLGPEIPPECYGPMDPVLAGYCGSLAAQWQTYNVKRLSSITSSAGYQIKLQYSTNTLTTYEALASWWNITKATGLNNAIEYCSPTASSCTFANAWPQATYTNWVDGKIDAVADPLSRTTNYAYATSPTSYQLQLTGIRLPGDAANTVTYGYTNDKVSSVARGGGTWSYVYGSGYTTVTDPASNSRKTNYNSLGLVTSTVAGGLTTSFAYCGASEANCPEDLLKKVTAPEGNYVQYAYDARGNRTTETHVAKPTTGLASIVTSAAYPATCANQKTCNKPTSTTDARGKVTDYVWNAANGELASVTPPADVAGVRPQTRVTYSDVYARYKNSAGTIVQAATPISLPTAVSSCRTVPSSNPASCAGSAEERVTTIAYPTSGASTALPTSMTTKAGNNTLLATTSVTYDGSGLVSRTDGPLAGTADTSRMFYNLARQVIGEVGPDPDGTGAAKYPAKRYTYNAKGQLYLTENGTVNGLSDADWAAFAPLDSTLVEFDGYRRPVRQRVRSGTTDYQVVDTVYDTSSRVTCSITRMVLSPLGAVATSCTPPQTTGPNGPDRVTYNEYDALGRAWKVTTAYGTTAAAYAYGATFRNNGTLASMTDGEGNGTTYEYDGHDRLVKIRYPSPTTDYTSSTTDYEQLGYDANGNVTSFRTRRAETLTMTYDNLNRLVAKVVPQRTGLAATHTRDVYFGYDLLGGMVYARFDSATGEGFTNAFDALGRLTGTSTNLDGVTRALGYLYDAAGNRTRLTYPDGNFVNYYRTDSGAFYYAGSNGSASPQFYPVRDAAGRVSVLNRWMTTAAAWGSPATMGYDAVSRLSSLATNLAGTTYDSTTTFGYNPAGQIASQARTNDAYAWTGSVAINRAYAANGLNEYTAVGGTAFGYDANANLISDGTNTFAYDVENRLVTRAGGAAATLRYDPLGRLYEAMGPSGTRRFLYDGDDLVAEYNTAGTMLRRYVHGPGAGDDPQLWYEGTGVADAARRYLYADERGSIVAVTDANGNVLGVDKYDEHGIPAATNIGAFQYTGQVWLPELGMYYYKARMYSPTLGRFMQTDPIGYGDGMNMYAYVHGDPINGVDPSGLNCAGTDLQTYCNPEYPNDDGPPITVNGYPWMMSYYSISQVDYLFGMGLGSQVPPGPYGWHNPSAPSAPSESRPKPQKEEPKKAHGIWKYGNWCGVGGAGAATDAVDAACRAHDQCYAVNGLSALDNLTGSSGSLQRCNQRLCNSVRQISPPPPPISDVLFRIRRSTPEEDRYLAAQQIDLYFSSFLVGDNACH